MKENKPIIGIDGNEANVVNRVGVNTYAYEVIKNIATLEDTWKETCSITVYLRSTPLPHMPKETKSFRYKILPGSGMWIIKTLMPHLYTTSQRPAVFWSPSHYIPPFAPMPRVCSIMDLGYLEFKDQFKKYDFWQLKMWSAWSIYTSKKILSISETTEKDIHKHYPVSVGKTVTTLLGYDKNIYPPKKNETKFKQILKKYSMGSKYVLFMSVMKPSKNIEGLLNAWSKIEKKHTDTYLVVAGRKGWLFENIFSLVKKLKIENRVVFTDFVAEEDKPLIISHAQAFVLPSFWEGFGLDVVSSMACGVPVIVSDRGSLPEVVGEAGDIINPDDPTELANTIHRILNLSSSERRNRELNELRRVTIFDWKITAQKTLNTLQSLI